MSQEITHEYDGSTPLTDERREAFCQEAIAVNDIKRAYELAGFKRARGNANRMAREPEVAKRLAWLWNEAAKLTEVLGARHIMAADVIATANMLDFWDRDPRTGRPKRINFKELPHELGHAIKEISFDSKGRPKLVLHDAPGMLRFLIERNYPTASKHELTGKDGTPLIPENASDLDLARRLAFLLERGARQAETEKEPA